MPIYEYVCQACHQRFEKLINGSVAPTCPSCNGHELEQQFSTFAVGISGAKTGSSEPMGPCGSCGDARGPGSCSLN